MKELSYDNGKINCYIKIDKDGTIIKSAPVLRKFIGQKLENLISWTNQNFKYCTLQQLKNE
jgi:hypothetical protein